MTTRQLLATAVATSVLLAGGAGVATSAQAGSVDSHITRIEITSKVSPVYGGAQIGTVGQYELLIGKVYGVTDPNSVRNKAVVDLGKAPRNAQGLVDYSADIAILKPIDLAKGNGQLIYEVVNRGNKLGLRALGLGNDFTQVANLSVVQEGYTFVWSGWQGNLRSTANATGGGIMAAVFPIATDSGADIVGASEEEIAIDGESATSPTFRAKLAYPATTLDSSKTTITYRLRAADARVPMLASSVRFVDANTIELTKPAGTDLGTLYNFVYQASKPTVMGLGFVSVRDVVSFLRNAATDDRGTPNPLAAGGKPAIRSAFAIGISQSGRYLRDFIYRDFNIDDNGRQVFDGMMPIIAGGKRGFFNARFAQPNTSPDWEHSYRGFPDSQFPFTYATLTDPISGKTDGLLKRCTASSSCPRIMQIDSDAETWQSFNSLVVTDTTGRPVTLPPNVRAYLLAGHPHSGADSASRGNCENLQNPLSVAVPLRALAIAMGEWVASGTLPPPSRYPSGSADGRLSADALAKSMPEIPGASWNPLLSAVYLTDYSRVPSIVHRDRPYPVFLTRVNADGNPFDGVVVPQIAVPIATYVGKNIRAAGYARGDACGLVGSYIPFARTKAARSANGDPRLSTEERYGSDADYQAKLKVVADQLVADRLLTPIDAAIIVRSTLP